jgi:hypothetical protein
MRVALTKHISINASCAPSVLLYALSELDVLCPGRCIPGHSVTGRLVYGRFVSWTFCNLDL